MRSIFERQSKIAKGQNDVEKGGGVGSGSVTRKKNRIVIGLGERTAAWASVLYDLINCHRGWASGIQGSRIASIGRNPG
jgi:hypothetical protein